MVSAGMNTDNTARVREIFNIPREVELSESAVREAVLAMLPLGTTEVQVQEKLVKANGGRDISRFYFPSNESGLAVIKMETPRRLMAVVVGEYVVFLGFDPEHKLTAVSVRYDITGL